MFKKHYSHFLSATQGKLYLTAHSHHFWPDVTRDAHIKYWDDSAQRVDQKWDYIFSQVMPETQSLIAQAINLTYPHQIAFASNTHEFVTRIVSCLKPQARVLSTDSEFYSFSRQMQRLQEDQLINWDQVATEDFDRFQNQLFEKIKTNSYDLIFISRVFFNSGMVFQKLNELKRQVQDNQSPECIVVIDDYHGFMAIPLDWKPYEDRFFYLSGSYKYASGGEGCCFLVTPKGSSQRPVNTGWFASFETLASNSQKNISYSDNGMRFSGATMDFTALYRLRSVLQWLQNENISVSTIHNYVQSLQSDFLNYVNRNQVNEISNAKLLNSDLSQQGHFLTFQFNSDLETQQAYSDLKSRNIFTDYRKNRLRFGFGLYHTTEDFLIFNALNF